MSERLSDSSYVRRDEQILLNLLAHVLVNAPRSVSRASRSSYGTCVYLDLMTTDNGVIFVHLLC